MTFDIRRLDGLSYDEAESILPDYITDTVNQFLKSSHGKAYMVEHPQPGQWIDTFIEMSYLYAEKTLTKMTKEDVRLVMESILPRKLALFDPREAEDAIPELVAFWTYLRDTYKFRSAGAIVKYLHSIADKFQEWMFDPARGGMAKSFMMQGMQAGYDMSTQEGLSAFQAEYNRRIDATQPSDTPTVPMVSPPPEVQQMFDVLGIELPAAGEPVNPEVLLEKVLGALGKVETILGVDLDEADEATAEADGDLPQPGGEVAQFRQMLFGEESMTTDVELSDDAIATLEAQTITETEPGTILQDFTMLLDYIGEQGIEASGKFHQITSKDRHAINAKLCKPVEIDLKRPVQKSYPQIHGLYMLLRAMGMVNIVASGKKFRLMLNPSMLEQWRQLNPTERYCTLLETWLIRSFADLLGEERTGPLTEGSRCFQSWHWLKNQPNLKFKAKDDVTEQLRYLPGLHNFALMEMFGCLTITSGKPKAGKGWRINEIELLPWGDAIMALVHRAYREAGLIWPSETNPQVPIAELQPYLTPYFPEWQQVMQLPKVKVEHGLYVFKVALNNKIWRRIAIRDDATLYTFSDFILDSMEFDDDHLHEFTYRNAIGREISVTHPDADSDLSTEEVQVGELGLTVGRVMTYVFDFGDWWEFQITLEAIKPNDDAIKVGQILEIHGEAPPQYPDDDFEDDEDDEDIE